MSVCAEPGCPVTVDRSRCPEHAARRDRQRGTSRQRGYDTEHRRRRAHDQVDVDAGRATCWRCHQPIEPDTPWDLGHADDGSHAGPEHADCNRSAAARASHRDR